MPSWFEDVACTSDVWSAFASKTECVTVSVYTQLAALVIARAGVWCYTAINARELLYVPPWPCLCDD